MSKAMADLMNDHEAILSALDIFTKILDSNKAKASVNAQEMTDFVNFLKEFADKCHHGKEEGMLFPAMIAAGVPDHGGPIGVMMTEHVQGRKLIHDMDEALEGVVDQARLEKAGRDYIDLLRAHIQKENMILFPMADRVLNGQLLDKMAENFDEHEEKVIGHGRHEELHAMLHDLQKKYSS
jgi:hemerythrin-like domain-containing protein